MLMAKKLIFLIAIFYSCSDIKSVDDRLKIHNYSTKPIVFDFGEKYPDTSLTSNFYYGLTNLAASDPTEPFTHTVLPSTTNAYRFLGSWDGEIPHIPSGKLEIFVFDVDVLRNVPWDSIAKNYLILKRYDLTLDSLKKMNWLIQYP